MQGGNAAKVSFPVEPRAWSVRDTISRAAAGLLPYLGHSSRGRLKISWPTSPRTPRFRHIQQSDLFPEQLVHSSFSLLAPMEVANQSHSPAATIAGAQQHSYNHRLNPEAQAPNLGLRDHFRRGAMQAPSGPRPARICGVLDPLAAPSTGTGPMPGGYRRVHIHG